MNHQKAFSIGFNQTPGFSKKWIGDSKYEKSYKNGVKARRGY